MKYVNNSTLVVVVVVVDDISRISEKEEFLLLS